MSSFAPIAAFKTLDYAQANERFSLDDLSFHEPDAMFGEEPESVFIHEGSVSHAGDVTLRDPASGIYIVNGDLTIGGTFSYSGSDDIPVLYVTGTLRVGSLAMQGEAHLWVGEQLIVKNCIVLDLSDAGGIDVEDEYEARALIDLRDSPMLLDSDSTAIRVQALAYEGAELNEDWLLPERALVAPFNVARPSFDAMVEAMRAGKNLLA